MNSAQSHLTSFGAGAALAFFFDRHHGRRRRKLVLDQLSHAMCVAEDSFGATLRDMSHRASGAVMLVRSELDYRMFALGDPDDVVVDRVRARLGRVVTHPHAIGVTAQDGHVTLTGPILAAEVDPLLAAVRRVRGVRDVDHHLDVHPTPGDVSALQGDGRERTQRPDPFQRSWSPTTRTVAATTGGALALYSLGRGGPVGAAAALAGAALLTRSATNMEFGRLFGTQGRRGLDVHKTINVNAPLDQVYLFWSNVENFPRFMSHVLEVRDLGEGRSHWTVTGPAGTPVRWQAVVTKAVPNQMLAWKSVGDPMVRHAGIVHFHENPDRTTQVDVQLTYSPPGGILGHAVAAFFGSDPKTAMDDDLVRFKSLIEDGKATAHGHAVTLADLTPTAAAA